MGVRVIYLDRGGEKVRSIINQQLSWLNSDSDTSNYQKSCSIAQDKFEDKFPEFRLLVAQTLLMKFSLRFFNSIAFSDGSVYKCTLF